MREKIGEAEEQLKDEKIKIEKEGEELQEKLFTLEEKLEKEKLEKTREKTFSEVVGLGEAILAEEHSAIDGIKEKVQNALTERHKLHAHCLATQENQLERTC